MLTEFKKFIARGNVLDLAVGVVIGAAFGKITTSLTENIIMPLLGWIFGTIDWSNHFLVLGSIPADYEGDPTSFAALKEAGVPVIGYGDLITQIVNFLLIAFALFLLVRSANKVMEEIEAWMEAERGSWEPWLAQQNGFLGRDLLWDPETEEGTLLIRWSSRENWKAIPSEEVEQVQIRFEQIAREAMSVPQHRDNPFPLVFEGELLPP